MTKNLACLNKGYLLQFLTFSSSKCNRIFQFIVFCLFGWVFFPFGELAIFDNCDNTEIQDYRQKQRSAYDGLPGKVLPPSHKITQSHLEFLYNKLRIKKQGKCLLVLVDNDLWES